MSSHKPIGSLLLFTLLLGVAQARILAAAQAKPEKPTVHIGDASQSGAFAQLWIAAHKGYFQAEGGFAASAETLKKYPRLVEATMRAVVRGHTFLGKGPEDQSKAIMSRYMRLPVADPRIVASYGFSPKMPILAHRKSLLNRHAQLST